MIKSDIINVPESLTHYQDNNMVKIEAKRLVINERINRIRWKREEKLLEMELNKFQNKLYVSRPKFSGLSSQIYNNTQKSNLLISHGNKSFVLNKKTFLPKIKFEHDEKFYLKKAVICNIDNNNTDKFTIDHHHYHPNDEDDDCLVSCNRSISVIIIKDRPIVPPLEKNREIIKFIFNLWRNCALEIKRLRQLKTKIQQNLMTRKLQRFFNAWRNKIIYSKQLTAKYKEQCELRDIKKIEMFVNMMIEKQKIPGKNKINDNNNKQMKNDEIFNDCIRMKMTKNNKNIQNNFTNFAESRDNRLRVQKKIIAEQRIKLAEQNQLIENMKLQQIQVESRISKMETIDIVKTVMNTCGLRSRRDYFMTQVTQQNKDEKLSNLSSSQAFPGHLEARAVARKEKLRQTQIEHEKILYEKNFKEQAKKIEEEKIRKEHQRNAEQKAKILDKEKECNKFKNAEKIKIMNQLADNVFRKYLLRNYVIKPLILLVKINRNKMIMAKKHCNMYLMKKTYDIWRDKVINQLQIKYKLSMFMYNKNLLYYHFQQWREFNKNKIRNYQIACDVYDLRIQEKYYNIWRKIIIKMQIQNNANKKIAGNFYDGMMKKNYFIRWKRYMIISDRVKESDKRREQWRKLVQMVIPDFSPKYRGVLIDD